MARPKRASWFKLFYHNRAAIDSVSDADAGSAIKAAFAYFDRNDIDPSKMSPMAYTVFCILRPQIDEALDEYRQRVERGRESQEHR